MEQFDLEKHINWSLFSKEEKELLTDCFNNGDSKLLVCLPGVLINTPEKEREIEKMVLASSDNSLDGESQVKEELDEFWATVDASTMTPEMEQEWQEKIDKEKAEKEEVLAKKREELGLNFDDLSDDNIQDEDNANNEGKIAETEEISPINEGKYTCSVCKQEFKSRIALLGHSRSHK